MTNPITELYNEDKILYYLRTHPDWYRVLMRYPERKKDFIRIAKEEMKLTTHHKLERLKNQVSLISMLSEYMNRK